MRLANARLSHWLSFLVCSLVLLETEGQNVTITYVENAVAKGAVCLDGSPPAYHFDKGFGVGINNWLVYIEGGGWCKNVTGCSRRMKTSFGSSKYMNKEYSFTGILSNEEKFNPDFYNWNRIMVKYCDGSSFTGDVEAVDPVTNLHYRGARIFQTVIEDLLAKGMENATNALLSGCSAGGLTSMLHCDRFKALLPNTARVKCLSDAGYFIHAKDISGTQEIETFFDQVATLHGSEKNLPPQCVSEMTPGLCFFPQNIVQQIQTPLFILNSAFDSWQIGNILAPSVIDPQGLWNKCKLNIMDCSANQLTIIQGFRLEFLRSLTELGNSSSRGMFINSCHTHCQSLVQNAFLEDNSPELNNKTIAKAVGDWYYDRNIFQVIDSQHILPQNCP